MVADFTGKENKDFFNKKMLLKTGGIIFLVIIFLLIVADVKIYQKKKQLVSQINNYQKQIEDLKNSSQNLKEEIANSDNPDYLEKLAYEQLGEQRPGEKEVIFVMPASQESQTVESKNPWDNFTAWLSQSWSWIKSIF